MASIIYVGLILFIGAIFIHRLIKQQARRRQGYGNNNRYLTPSPPALPLLGHLHLLGRYPHQSLYKLSQKYGPLMSIYLGNIHTVVVSSPAMAAEFLRTHDRAFANRPHTEVSLELSYNGRNLGLAPYGQYWIYLRKVCSTRIFSSKVFASFEKVREEELRVMVGCIYKRAIRGEEADVRRELLRLSNNVICRMALGRRLDMKDGEEMDSLRKLIRECFRLVGAFNVGDYVPWLKWADLQGYRRAARQTAKELDGIIQKIIDEHRMHRKEEKSHGHLANTDLDAPADFVDTLLSLQEEEDANIQMTNESIKAVVLDMFAAGTETTAMSTEWALAELIRKPEMMRKAQEELDVVVGRERKVREADLVSLKYIEAVVKESLRLHPVTPLLFPHKSSEDVSIEGYKLPHGTRLFVNAWAIGRDENSWDNPHEFVPERFLRQGASIDVLGSDFRVIPFGSGRRGCPGNTMGFLMVSLALATLLHTFSWPIVYDISMKEEFGLTVTRDSPLTLHVTPRFPPSHPYYIG